MSEILIAETPEVATPDPDVSLADHSAQFDPVRRPAPEPVESAPNAFETTVTQAAPVSPTVSAKHRAQSNKAQAADVPRINELTKKLRAAQAELEQLRTGPARVATPAGSVTTAPATAISPAEAAPSVRPLKDVLSTPDLSSGEPLGEVEFFTAYPDAAYGAYQRYLSRYAVLEHAQTVEASRVASQAGQAEHVVGEIAHERAQQFGSQIAEFVTAKPDFGAKVTALGSLAHLPIPPLLMEAMMEAGPEMYYALVSDPALFAEMHLLADGKPVTESHVAGMRRRLTSELSRMPAAVTGSAATPFRHTPAPRPPNPVRTGPMKTGDDPPADGHSLAEHSRAYGPRR